MELPSGPPGAATCSVSRRHLLLAGVAGVVPACSGERDGAGRSLSESRSAAPPKQSAMVLKAADDPQIVVGAGLIPGMVNSSADGLMVDLIKTMAETYQRGVAGVSGGGAIVVKAMTVGRLDVELAEGTVDMAMPYIRMAPDSDKHFKYRFTKQAYGKVAFVLYSRKATPVTVDAIKRATGQQPFPYNIESAEFDWGFPVIQFLSIESAFKKLATGRIDAFIWAQEEADEQLRLQGEKGIVRELYGVYEDVFAVQRNARGDFVEKVYDQVLGDIRRSGKLKALYSKIHLPFNDWQP